MNKALETANMLHLLEDLRLKADFDSCNRAARAYKILNAQLKAFNEPDYDQFSSLSKEISIQNTIKYAIIAIQ